MGTLDEFSPVDFSSIKIPDYSSFPQLAILEPPNIELGPTVQDKIDEQTEILEKRAKAQITELEKQNAILEAQNKELEKQTKVHISNYEELYRIAQQQEKQIQENEKETIKNKIYNKITLAIAIISLLIAICAWLFPNIIGG